jgi:hypothetical protein
LLFCPSLATVSIILSLGLATGDWKLLLLYTLLLLNLNNCNEAWKNFIELELFKWTIVVSMGVLIVKKLSDTKINLVFFR